MNGVPAASADSSMVVTTTVAGVEDAEETGIAERSRPMRMRPSRVDFVRKYVWNPEPNCGPESCKAPEPFDFGPRTRLGPTC